MSGRQMVVCPGSSQRWVLGPEGGRGKDGNARRHRAECPSCRRSAKQFGWGSTMPRIDNPAHTVPMHYVKG